WGSDDGLGPSWSRRTEKRLSWKPRLGGKSPWVAQKKNVDAVDDGGGADASPTRESAVTVPSPGASISFSSSRALRYGEVPSLNRISVPSAVGFRTTRSRVGTQSEPNRWTGTGGTVPWVFLRSATWKARARSSAACRKRSACGAGEPALSKWRGLQIDQRLTTQVRAS